ncbi:MAG: ABC transporter ATP-binding protein [Bacteroidetes bacterium]|nr:ABC transporter ATP-binding protein [Bacteroidota bacterium]
MIEPIVTIEKASFSYVGQHRTVEAIKEISISVYRGELFCLVGPDGAGKTTIIRMMCGILKPTSGVITVAGYDTTREREHIKRCLGYLSQRFSLYHDLTVNENIEFFAKIHGLKHYERRQQQLLEITRLAPYSDRLAGALSGGMKQKLALICTLIHSPEIIFLDEPTTGVDPVSRREFWKILLSFLKEGLTIIVTTPYLDEAERCSRIALMSEGTILTCDTPQAIRTTFPYGVIEVVCSHARSAFAVLVEHFGKEQVQLYGDRVHVLVSKKERKVKTILNLLRGHKIDIVDYRLTTASLEDVFVAQMTSKSMRHG